MAIWEPTRQLAQTSTKGGVYMSKYTQKCEHCDFASDRPTESGARKSLAVHMRMKHASVAGLGQVKRKKARRARAIPMAEAGESGPDDRRLHLVRDLLQRLLLEL